MLNNGVNLTKTGIGARAEHVRELLSKPVDVGFLEVHAENYFGESLARDQLLALRELYSISLHGVGLSLGRADGLDMGHVQQLKRLVDDVQPVFVSEHLAWSALAGQHVPDLLPVPLTQEALTVVCNHIDRVQDVLGREILVENPSLYMNLGQQDFDEPDFLMQVAHRTGCRLLLDVNNVAVSAYNTGFDAATYLARFGRFEPVAEIHLAGYQENMLADGRKMLIDTHGHAVFPEVWNLYEQALRQFGDVPTLIEWDTDIPALAVLLAEAKKADAMRTQAGEKHAVAG